MSETLAKIDKFYLVLAIVLLFMAILVIFTFRGIFSAFIIAYEVDQNELTNMPKVNREKLEESYNWAFNKTTIPLEIR